MKRYSLTPKQPPERHLVSRRGRKLTVTGAGHHVVPDMRVFYTEKEWYHEDFTPRLFSL